MTTAANAGSNVARARETDEPDSIRAGRPLNSAWLFVLWFVTTGALLWGANWVSTQRERDYVEDFRNELVDKAKLAETVVASRLRDYDATLLVLRASYVAEPTQFHSHVKMLRAGPLADPNVLVVVVDRDGFLAYTDTPNVKSRPGLRDLPYFRAFAEGRVDHLYVGEPGWGRVTQRYMLPLARPMYDARGAFFGVIALSILQESLGTFGESLRVPGHTDIGLITASGAWIARSRDTAGVRGAIAHPEMLAKFNGRGRTFIDRSMVDGSESYFAFRRLKGLPLIAYASASPRSVKTEMRFQRNLLASGAVVVSLLLLLLARVTVQRQRLTTSYIATQRAYLTQAQRMAGMGSWELDLASKKFRWSDEMYALLGALRRDVDVDFESFLARVGEADRSTVRDAIHQAVAEGTSRVEFSARRDDGQRRHFVGHCEASRDGTGKVSSLIGTLRDVTEERNAQEALRESEARFRNLTELSADWYWEQDGDLRLTRYDDGENSRSALANRPRVGMRRWDVPALNMTAADWDAHRATLERRESFRDLEIERPNANGRGSNWVSISGEPMFDAEGKFKGYRGVGRDITERKGAEIERARLAAIVESAQDAIIGRGADFKVTSWNKAAEHLFGYSAHEAIGREVDFIVPEDRKDEVVRSLNLLAGSERVPPYDTVRLARDGRLIDVSISFAPIRDTAGRIVGASLTYRDIRERKRAEREKAALETQALQAQKMDSIGRLAGGVAHDFNNMLTVILGNAVMAIEQTDPSQQVHKELVEIRKAAERSADLTRQLLAFARKQVIAPKVLDLNDTVGGIIKMLRRLIGEAISLTLVPKASLWPIEVDPSQIDQVLANLCINARDAIAGVGRIVIETGNRTLDEDFCRTRAGFVPGDYVELSVGDNGHGMDGETLAHIFEPFYTTKATGEGTGLGLATVYGVVKQNGGFIDVASEPGRGTKFTIYLPRFRGGADGEHREEGTARPAARGRETILLVEDEPSILKLTTRILTRQGYAVVSAAGPKQAIQLASDHAGPIHLLVTDVVMPEMNGRDLARELQSRISGLKVLFMSGYTADIIIRQGVMDDGMHFIQKPFSIENLAVKVRETLDGVHG